MARKIAIGCSGFHYKDWKEKFYPENVPAKDWLRFYAGIFNTVEINNSFYRLPTEKTVRNWHDATPENFSFTIKGSRYVTHMKKLENLGDGIQRVYQVADWLEEKLACVLWQLPPQLRYNPGKLEDFCQGLNPHYRNVIEFRHNSWFSDDIYAIMRKYNVGFCILSAPQGLKEDLVETADFSYVRFHGKKEWFHYDYTLEEMQLWAERVRSLKAKEVFAYFNNDVGANATRNAQSLEKLVKG